jgi:hypothetical protein
MLLSAALLLLVTHQAAPPEPGPWALLSSLAGEWQGVGSGAPGEATGGFTLAFDLQNKVLVRRSRAVYASSTHEDLTIIYREEPSGQVRAAYYDNEGHVIHYTVTAASGRLVFLGDATAGQPRFRLTYVLTSPHEVRMDFDIAPPNSPAAFKPYIQATARRRTAR